MTPRHPAPYTPAVLELMRSMIEPGWRVLDPMAGIGRVHQLCPPAADTVGVEIEPEWAAAHPRTIVGDARALPFAAGSFDCVAVSPCPSPDLRVLTADLRWVLAGDLVEGDRLLSFTESNVGVSAAGYAGRRRWSWAEVTRSRPGRKACSRVWLADGSSQVVSSDHPWLGWRSKGYSTQQWIRTDRLVPGVSQVARQVEPWMEQRSWDAGWLAGIMDGEGSVSFGAHGSPKLQVCQVDGPVHDAIGRRLRELGHPVNVIERPIVEGRQQVMNTYVVGGWPGMLRALGSIRPERLLSVFQQGDVSTRCISPVRVMVEAVEPLGDSEIQELTTSTGTLIVEGYLQHNTYGNRMADHHEARDGSHRRTYRHYLGRPLTDGNGGGMQWGDEYRALHEAAWAEAWRVIRPGGCFVLNVKDHVRKGERQAVSAWHMATLGRVGFTVGDISLVRTRGFRFGQNHDQRADAEYVVQFWKEAA